MIASASKEVICDKCGTRARTVIIQKARMRCQLEADGTIGKVLSASRDISSTIGYECGGGHIFQATTKG